MGKKLGDSKRYTVQAKRITETKWSEWTKVDTYEDAVKHSKHIEELGYEARIIDRGDSDD